MPSVDIDSEADGVLTDDSVVKVSARGMDGEANSWFLSPGEDIVIGDDGPNEITVEALDG